MRLQRGVSELEHFQLLQHKLKSGGAQPAVATVVDIVRLAARKLQYALGVHPVLFEADHL
eukprot:5367946-Pyramimonas_sp.AAC.1